MPSTEMITIRELLRDPQYKEYFIAVPVLPEHYTPATRPWKLFVLKKDERAWRSKRFGTYREAFEGFKRMLPTVENAAINCPALSFMPPIRTVRIKGRFDRRGNQIKKSVVWKPKLTDDMAGHSWCPYCRRPTLFRMARINPNRAGGRYVLPMTEPALRCMLCGASESVVDLRHPEKHQQWDTNRPRFFE